MIYYQIIAQIAQIAFYYITFAKTDSLAYVVPDLSCAQFARRVTGYWIAIVGSDAFSSDII